MIIEIIDNDGCEHLVVENVLWEQVENHVISLKKNVTLLLEDEVGNALQFSNEIGISFDYEDGLGPRGSRNISEGDVIKLFHLLYNENIDELKSFEWEYGFPFKK